MPLEYFLPTLIRGFENRELDISHSFHFKPITPKRIFAMGSGQAVEVKIKSKISGFVKEPEEIDGLRS